MSIAQASLALSGYTPEHLIKDYGQPASVNREHVHLGVLDCTFSNRVVAGISVEPYASFDLVDGQWLVQVISYKLPDSITELAPAKAIALLEDIRQGYWRFEDVPHIARDMQVARYECIVTLTDAWKDEHINKTVATAVQTKSPKYITVNIVY
jgi:hypothetical protein